LNSLNCTDREILVEDCASGQSLIQEFRSATREGDIVTTIVPTDEKPGDLKIVGKLCQPRPPYPEETRNVE
jgi:hypothetical protein